MSNSADLISEDLHILHHALGITDPDLPDRSPYRNHFVAGTGHADMQALERLEAEGLMERRTSALCGGDLVFSVTESGRRLALETRPRASRDRQRYRKFLIVRDAVPDLTFREFLTAPEWAEWR